MRFVAYLVCRIMRFVAYWVCRIMRLVAYWVFRIMRFVATLLGLLHYEVCRLLCLSHYKVCRLLGLLHYEVFALCLSHYDVCRIMTFIAYRVCRSIPLSPAVFLILFPLCAQGRWCVYAAHCWKREEALPPPCLSPAYRHQSTPQVWENSLMPVVLFLNTEYRYQYGPLVE